MSKNLTLEKQRSCQGFTIVELVVVIVLLSILSITAIPHMVKPRTFTPATLNQLLISQGRLAAQAARAQPQVTVSLSLQRLGAEWRVSLQRDGVGNTDTIAAHNVQVVISNSAANVTLADGEQLLVSYGNNGSVTVATAAAALLQPELGIGVTLQGDSTRQLCLYPNGYVSARNCT